MALQSPKPFQRLLLRGLQNSETGWNAEERLMTPLMSWTVMAAMAKKISKPIADAFPMIGLLGSVLPSENDSVNESSLDAIDPVFLNIDSPWSVFVCGSQGSGKSHTVSCILESCLFGHSSLGQLSTSLSGIVFHFDKLQGDSVAEASYMCSHMKVRVLVSPTNIIKRRTLYESLAGAKNNLVVEPFHLLPKHLNSERMLRLMAVDQQADHMPLYMHIVLRVLREMAETHKGSAEFDWKDFEARISRQDLQQQQRLLLNMRLDVIKSFMPRRSAANSKQEVEKVEHDPFVGSPGELIVVDLTDPFLDSETACTLFDIVLSEFVDRTRGGKIAALDEAHNYMNAESPAAEAFTGTILKTVREQRHKSIRVVVATQEPTLNPALLDLCSITFVHRFTSPAWLDVLYQHLAGAQLGDLEDPDPTSSDGRETRVKRQGGRSDLLRDIVQLRVGESLLFCPTAALDVGNVDETIQKLHFRYAKFRTRVRLTVDGGRSLLAAGSRDEDGLMGEDI